MSKRELTITIAGEAGAGKSTVMQEIVALLQSLNIEVETDWGLDGKPSGDHDYKIKRISEKARVRVKMLQLRRNTTNDDLL